MCYSIQRVNLAMAVEQVVAGPTLAHLWRSVVYRGESCVDRHVQWTRHRVGSVVDLCNDRAGGSGPLAYDQRRHARDVRRSHRCALQERKAWGATTEFDWECREDTSVRNWSRRDLEAAIATWRDNLRNTHTIV